MKHYSLVRFICCALILFIAVSFSSCTNESTEDFNPVLSARNERDLGNSLVEVAKAHPESYDILSRERYKCAYEYLDIIMRTVKTQSKIKNTLDWEILVLDDNEKNAFVLPGGKIFITIGFLNFLRSESQLLALVAHEAYYADRIDQTLQEELSVVMHSLKESDVYENEGTKIFVDITRGNNKNALEVLNVAKSLQFKPENVLDADEFVLRVICQSNHKYSAYGIKEIVLAVEKLEEASVSDWTWFENRPPLPNNLYDYDSSQQIYTRDKRISLIDNYIIQNECIENNKLQNIVGYSRFLSCLPK